VCVPLLCRLKKESQEIVVNISKPMFLSIKIRPTTITLKATFLVDVLMVFAPTVSSMSETLKIIETYKDRFVIKTDCKKSKLVALNAKES
jgi:hypothetical protein